MRSLNDLVNSVKKRAKQQGRTFSFFDNDEAATALAELQTESAACSEINESVAHNGPRGEALKLDLSLMDAQKLRGALDKAKKVAVTIDGRVRCSCCATV